MGKERRLGWGGVKFLIYVRFFIFAFVFELRQINIFLLQWFIGFFVKRKIKPDWIMDSSFSLCVFRISFIRNVTDFFCVFLSFFAYFEWHAPALLHSPSDLYPKLWIFIISNTYIRFEGITIIPKMKFNLKVGRISIWAKRVSIKKKLRHLFLSL